MLRIKEVIKERGLTVASIAEKMGISPPSLSQVINGNPTASMLERVAEAIGVPITELFEAPAAGNFKCPNCGASLRLSAEVTEGSIFD